jgi:hypothetical protein
VTQLSDRKINSDNIILVGPHLGGRDVNRIAAGAILPDDVEATLTVTEKGIPARGRDGKAVWRSSKRVPTRKAGGGFPPVANPGRNRKASDNIDDSSGFPLWGMPTNCDFDQSHIDREVAGRGKV